MKGKRDTEIGIAGIKVMGANYSMTHKRTDNEIKKQLKMNQLFVHSVI